MLTTAHFRRLWAQLHNRAARGAYFTSLDIPEPAIEQRWLEQFSNRIRCSGCRRHWREVLAKLPPDFSSRSGYFRWTVRAHNAINRLLKKPVVDLRTAKRHWHFDTFWNQKVTL